MVKTSTQPNKHIIHVYVYKYNEQPVSQNSNDAAHTLPRRTATTQCLAQGGRQLETDGAKYPITPPLKLISLHDKYLTACGNLSGGGYFV